MGSQNHVEFGVPMDSSDSIQEKMGLVTTLAELGSGLEISLGLQNPLDDQRNPQPSCWTPLLDGGWHRLVKSRPSVANTSPVPSMTDITNQSWHLFH